MPNVIGARTVYGVGGKENGGRLVVDMREEIAQLEPNDSPFITFLRASKKNTRVVENPKFEWLEDQLLANGSEAAANVAASATSVSVVDGSVFRAGDVIRIGTEQALVTAVSGNTLTITPNFGTEARSAAFASGGMIYIIGKAYPENSTSPNAISTQVAEKFNYTQIFRTPIELSRTADKTKMYGGNDRGYQRSMALLDHKRDIAKAFYMGTRYFANDHVTRTTGGLFSFLSQAQAFSPGSGSGDVNLTYFNFDQYVAQKVFRYGSREKMLFAGPRLSTAINKWAMDKVVTDMSTEKAFGMRVKKLNTSYGDLIVVYDPLFADLGCPDYGVIVDTSNVRYVHVKDSDTKLYTNIQENDRDGIKDEYLTECGLEVRLPKTHMLITGAYVPDA